MKKLSLSFVLAIVMLCTLSFFACSKENSNPAEEVVKVEETILNDEATARNGASTRIKLSCGDFIVTSSCEPGTDKFKLSVYPKVQTAGEVFITMKAAAPVIGGLSFGGPLGTGEVVSFKTSASAITLTIECESGAKVTRTFYAIC